MFCCAREARKAVGYRHETRHGRLQTSRTHSNPFTLGTCARRGTGHVAPVFDLFVHFLTKVIEEEDGLAIDLGVYVVDLNALAVTRHVPDFTKKADNKQKTFLQRNALDRPHKS